jgi:zinc metalloprotease ZmpB
VDWGGLDELNAYFDPGRDTIVLGLTRDLDVATDAGVVVHEYGHAVVHAYAPALMGSGAPGAQDAAIHEGYADFLACSRFDDPLQGEALHLALYHQGGAESYLRAIDFDPRAPGRHCDARRRWPADASFDPHVTGMILSAALWDLRAAMARQSASGANAATRLAFTALTYLAPSNDDLTDVLESILEADRRARGGHATLIRAAFAAHGVTTGAAVDGGSGLPWLPGGGP